MQEVILLTGLLVKHAIADLFIQSFRKPTNKSNWFDRGLQLHSLDHSILTLIVLLLIAPVPYHVCLVLAVCDHLLHSLIDWIKTNVVRHFSIGRDGPLFWRIQSLDQIAHYLTYALIVVVVVQYGS